MGGGIGYRSVSAWKRSQVMWRCWERRLSHLNQVRRTAWKVITDEITTETWRHGGSTEMGLVAAPS